MAPQSTSLPPHLERKLVAQHQRAERARELADREHARLLELVVELYKEGETPSGGRLWSMEAIARPIGRSRERVRQWLHEAEPKEQQS